MVEADTTPRSTRVFEGLGEVYSWVSNRRPGARIFHDYVGVHIRFVYVTREVSGVLSFCKAAFANDRRYQLWQDLEAINFEVSNEL